MKYGLGLLQYRYKRDPLGPVQHVQHSGRYKMTIRIRKKGSHLARRLEAQLASANQWPPA